MKFLLQCVENASVRVNEQVVGAIQKGFLVFIGLGKDDTKEAADYLIDQVLKLKIMQTVSGEKRIDIQEAQAEILLVSQFTLYADCSGGTRPSFSQAMPPAQAKELYDYIVQQFQKKIFGRIKTGQFGAYMKVELVNDGPFTILLEK